MRPTNLSVQLPHSIHFEDIHESTKFPRCIHIDVTNHCNKNCDFCCLHDRYNNGKIPLGYMNYDFYQTIIDQCNEYHGRNMKIDLSKDGESIMHPKFFKMVQYAKKYNMFTTFSTNGWLLYKRRKQLCNSGLDETIVSISDEKGLIEAEKFIEYKGFKNKPLTKFKIFDNYEYQPRREIKADDIIIQHIRNWLDSDMQRVKKIPCYKLLFNPAITWDGLLVICCVEYLREGVLGDLNHGSIAQYWPIAKFLYMEQVKGNYLPPCDRCLRFDDREIDWGQAA